MIRLYGSPRTRANRVMWLLEEMGIEYEQRDAFANPGDPPTEEVARLNPNARVPILESGDFVMWESLAINLHLVEHHGGELAPRTDAGKAGALQWTLWAAGAHSKAAGWDREAAAAESLGWVVRSHDVTYRAAAKAGDEIVVRTWVSDIDRFASRRKYLVCRPADQTLLTRVQTRWVYVDLSRHSVVPIPEQVRSTIKVIETTPPLPWE